MNTENHDLFAEQRRRKSQIVKLLSAYSQRYRMTQFDARHLQDHAIQEIGCEIVDFFENRFLHHTQKAASKSARPSSPTEPEPFREI